MDTIELIYTSVIAIAFLVYIHIAMTYSFSRSHLALLNQQDNLNIFPMAFSCSMVCVLSFCYLKVDRTGPWFGISFIAVMLSVVIAKYYYFNSLFRFLRFDWRIDRWYGKLTLFYIPVSILFLGLYLINGESAFFDLSQPELSGIVLRHKLIPYALNNYVKLVFAPNYLLAMLGYIYLVYVSYKRREFIICFGVVFTIFSILYTNSYHLISIKYWLPLNIVADLFELLRLHNVQKMSLAKSVQNHQVKMEEISQQLQHYELNKTDLSVFKHDLNNDLTISLLNLSKAKMLLKKKQGVDVSDVMHAIEKSMIAQTMASNFIQARDNSSELGLATTIESIAKVLDIPVRHNIDPDEKLHMSGFKFEKVITNLMKNAHEANLDNPDKWIQIIYNKKDHLIEMKIIDSGLYSNIKEPDKLFIQNYSTKGTHGRGIGLYSVKQTLEQANGHISLLNENGHTCFHITLPYR
jgi:hypothetical protein